MSKLFFIVNDLKLETLKSYQTQAKKLIFLCKI